MSETKILLPVALFTGAYALVKYNNFQTFKRKASVYIEALNVVPGSFAASNFTQIKFLLKLKIKNPTNFEIDLQNIFIEVFANDQKIAEVYSIEKVSIRKQSALIFKNEIKIDFKTLPKNILTAFENSKTNGFEIKIKGNLKSFFGSVNFSQTINQDTI